MQLHFLATASTHPAATEAIWTRMQTMKGNASPDVQLKFGEHDWKRREVFAVNFAMCQYQFAI